MTHSAHTFFAIRLPTERLTVNEHPGFLKARVVGALRGQLPDHELDQLATYFEDDPAMFATAVTIKVKAGDVHLPTDLLDCIRFVIQGSQRSE